MAAAASSTSERRWYEARRSRMRGSRNHGGISDIVRTHRRMIIDDGTRSSRHQVRGATQPDPAQPWPIQVFTPSRPHSGRAGQSDRIFQPLPITTTVSGVGWLGCCSLVISKPETPVTDSRPSRTAEDRHDRHVVDSTRSATSARTLRLACSVPIRVRRGGRLGAGPKGSCGVGHIEWSGYAVGPFCSSLGALRYYRDLHGVV